MIENDNLLLAGAFFRCQSRKDGHKQHESCDGFRAAALFDGGPGRGATFAGESRRSDDAADDPRWD